MYGGVVYRSPGSKKPDPLACILLIPGALLFLFCGVFGIGPAINMVVEREMQQRYLLTTCLILNNTALRSPCKGTCYGPAWVVLVNLPNNTTTIANATNNPIESEILKFDEAVRESRERRPVGLTLSCFYDSRAPNATVRFTEPSPGPELAKTIVLYVFSSIGFLFMVFLLMVSICKPAWWVRIDQKWRSSSYSTKTRWHTTPTPAPVSPMRGLPPTAPAATPTAAKVMPTPTQSQPVQESTDQSTDTNDCSEPPAGFESTEMQSVSSESSSSSSSTT